LYKLPFCPAAPGRLSAPTIINSKRLNYILILPGNPLGSGKPYEKKKQINVLN